MRLFLSFLVLSLICPTLAHAWRVDTCKGRIRGMQEPRTFLLDRCNIPVFSDRYNDIAYVASQWNSIGGVKDVFRVVTDDDDCKLEGDDVIAFVDGDFIDGYAGSTSWDTRVCGITDRADGRFYDIKIYISTSNFNIGPSTPLADYQTVRSVLFHEMGHALGAKHDTRGFPNMMWDPSNAPRVGNFNRDGKRNDAVDSLLPDDIDFASTWYGEEGGGQDVAISGQTWTPSVFDTTNVRPINLNVSRTITMCPGQTQTVGFSHMILGKNDVPCSTPYVIKFLLSPDRYIEWYDYEVASWSVCGNRGERFVNTATFQIPSNMPSGTYNLGALVDPAGVRNEEREGNNGIDFAVNVKVQSLCFGAISFRNWGW